jgi:hypothetical protein
VVPRSNSQADLASAAVAAAATSSNAPGDPKPESPQHHQQQNSQKHQYSSTSPIPFMSPGIGYSNSTTSSSNSNIHNSNSGKTFLGSSLAIGKSLFMPSHQLQTLSEKFEAVLTVTAEDSNCSNSKHSSFSSMSDVNIRSSQSGNNFPGMSPIPMEEDFRNLLREHEELKKKFDALQ